MIEDNIINKEANERTVLVGLATKAQNEIKANEYLDELAFLARTAGAEPEKRFVQKMDYPNPRTYVGTGKLEEIRQYVEDNEIVRLFDCRRRRDADPGQYRRCVFNSFLFIF